MRRIGDLLKDLGFKEGSSVEVQKAFIKHLVNAADRSSIQNVSLIPEQKSKPTESEKSANTPDQLSFDPEILKAGNR